MESATSLEQQQVISNTTPKGSVSDLDNFICTEREGKVWIVVKSPTFTPHQTRGMCSDNDGNPGVIDDTNMQIKW
jgi:hypothetical protein